jgi:hypothetical protein
MKLARRYQAVLDSGEFENRAAIARHSRGQSGTSDAHTPPTQVKRRFKDDTTGLLSTYLREHPETEVAGVPRAKWPCYGI